MARSTSGMPITVFLAQLAHHWVRCKDRFERMLDRIKPLERKAQRIENAKGKLWAAKEQREKANNVKQIATAEEAVEAAQSSLASLGGEVEWGRLNASLLALEPQGELEDAAFHDHPFPDVVKRIVTLTGWRALDLREAAIRGFEGAKQLVARLNRLERDGNAERLYRDFLAQHPELAKQIGLTSGEPATGPPPGFVPLSTMLADVQGSYSRAHKFIEEANIQTWRPTSKARRLYVNAPQWINKMRKSQPSDKAIESFLVGAEQRKAAIQKKTTRRTRELPGK